MIFLLSVLSLTAIFDVLNLVKERRWRELMVALVFLSTGLIYGVGHIFEVEILNPTDITNVILKQVFEIMDKLLK